MITDREFVDADGRDWGSVSSKLPHKHQLVEVPHETGAVPGPAHYNVVGGGRGQTSDRLCVAVEWLLQTQALLVLAAAKLPHVDHL